MVPWVPLWWVSVRKSVRIDTVLQPLIAALGAILAVVTRHLLLAENGV